MSMKMVTKTQMTENNVNGNCIAINSIDSRSIIGKDNDHRNQINYSDHYHLGERTPTAINIMDGVRSLICDLNGIIIAEMVYRCMICDVIFESVPDVQMHYQKQHIDMDNFSPSPSDANFSNADISSPFSSDSSLNLPSLTLSSSKENSTESMDESSSVGSESLNSSDLIFNQIKLPSQKRKLKPKKFKQLNAGTNKKPKSKVKVKVEVKEETDPNSDIKSGKSGIVTCEICHVTKYYSCVQRRYGCFTCITCFKFFTKYLREPSNYSCSNDGNCNLNITENLSRCKSCWLNACLKKYVLKKNSQLNRSYEEKLQRVKSEYRKGRHYKIIPEVKVSVPLKAMDTKSNHEKLLNSHKKQMSNVMASRKLLKSKVKNKKTIKESIIKRNSIPKTPLKKINTNGTKSEISSAMKSHVQKNGGKSILVNNSQKTIRKYKKSCKIGHYVCGTCTACKAEDCNKCVNCLDKPKNGGSYRLKAKCIKRQCLKKNFK